MKKIILSLLVIFLTVGTGFSQQKRTLTLQEVISMAKTNSRTAKQAETSMAFGYWGFQFYKSRFNPSLNLNGTVPALTKSVTAVTQQDGTIAFRQVNQSNSNLELGLNQSIPWTNTQVSLNTSMIRFDNFAAVSPTPQTSYQGVPLNLRIIQPLFAVNNFKWDKKIEPLNFEKSKKEYAQSQEQIAQEVTALFFGLLTAQVNLQIAEQNVSKNDTVYRIEQGRYNIGTTTEDQLLQTELNLLTSQRDAQQAALDVQTTSLELRNYIGLNKGESIELILPEEIPFFEIDADKAIEQAKANRADYIDFQIRRLNGQKQVADARALRFSADIVASFGYNNNAFDFGDLYSDPNSSSLFRLGFNLPILDGGRNKARMARALALQQQTEFQVEQNEINFSQEIQTAVRNFAQVRQQIEIAKKGDEISQKRFEISNNRYLIGKIDIQQYTNALRDKDQSKQGYISALRQYWVAYYQLRNLTLYDFLLNQALYNPLLEFDRKTGIPMK